MNKFEKHWSDFYFSNNAVIKEADIEIFINDNLAEEDKLTVLTRAQGQTFISLTPEFASQIGLNEEPAIKDLASFRALLLKADIGLHSPDKVFYSLTPQLNKPMNKNTSIRRLTENDKALFVNFTQKLDAEELDNAWVELDHWAVFGLFLNEQLVCATSLYPWQKTNIADLGVITLPEFRGKGMAKTLVNYAHKDISETRLHSTVSQSNG